MKSSFRTILVASSLLLAAPLFGQSHGSHHAAPSQEKSGAGQLLPVTEKEAAWAEKARQTYPLKTCVVSDEALGSMGEPDAFIYRVSGQPDRLVLFCCGGCQEDFMADPAAHLAKLDAAKKDKSGHGSAASGHQH